MLGLVQHAPQWFGVFVIAVVAAAVTIALVWLVLVIGIVAPAALRLWRQIRNAFPARARGEVIAVPKQLAAPAETLEGEWRYADGAAEVPLRRALPERWQ